QPAIQRIGALDDELTVLLRRWSGDSLACDYRARQRRHSEREPQAAVSQGHGVSGHGVSGRAGWGRAGPLALATTQAAADTYRPPCPDGGGPRCPSPPERRRPTVRKRPGTRYDDAPLRNGLLAKTVDATRPPAPPRH